MMTSLPPPPDARALAWPHGAVAVNRLGAMIGPATFLLPDGRQVSPLQVAPWHSEPEARALPGILRQLRGEWPCVPFGYPVPSGEMSAEWQAVMPADEVVEDAHGYSSNHEWDWDAVDDTAVALVCRYPGGGPIEALHRTVRPDPAAPAIDFTLRVDVRESCRLPVGLHFTFRLPAAAGGARLEPGRFDHGRTYPGTVEPGASLFAPDRLFSGLAAVPGRLGAPIDAARLPFADEVEELLQLNGIDGTFALANEAERYRVRLSWDADACPSVLLWMSNRGRKSYPWSGRHLAIGIEPICSPFGLGPATARLENPITRSGTSTTVTFDPAAPFVTRYRLAVEPL